MKSGNIRNIRVHHRIITKSPKRDYVKNTTTLSMNNNTGAKCIYYDRVHNAHRVTIRKIYIGSYIDFFDAVKARDDYNEKLFFEDMLSILED